jgi:Domain of unknown function (DUF4232)
MHSRVSVTLAAAVTAAGVIATATGCHSSTTSAADGGGATRGGATAGGQAAGSPGSGTGTSAPGSPGTAAGVARCPTAALTIAVDDSQADATAGSTYYPVDFTNTSATPCTMTGYPGVSFVTAANGAGQQIGAAAQRNPQYDPAVVRLEPHAHAHAWLQVSAADNYPETSCHPVTAHGLRIYPPDQTEAGYVTQDFSACALPAAGLLTIMPLRPGQGAQGSTP